jgi:hypothetical protein
MNLPQRISQLAIVLTLVGFAGRDAAAGDWPKLLDHPRAGTNAIALVNADALRLGASKLKHFKGGEQKGDAANLVAELPEYVKKAALSAFLDLDSLDPVWEMGTLTFVKNKLPTPKGIAEHVGGYLDKIAGRPIVYSPRNRYIMLDNADRLTINKPADRAAVANWVRGLSKPALPLPDYLKRVVQTADDDTPLVLAVDMTDTISPVPLKEKLATLESVGGAKLDVDKLVNVVSELEGLTFTVALEEQFQGRLQFDFAAAPTLLQKAGKAVVLEVLGRRGILLPEMNGWEGHVEGKALVLSGPLNAVSIVNLLTLFTSSPLTDTTPEDAPGSLGDSASSADKKKAQASKRYFTSVTRVIEETRNVKGKSVAEHGVWNDKLARKIDQIPMLDVDPDLLDYGAQVSQLIRGAGVVIKKANMVAGTQKAPDYTVNTNYGYGVGYGYGYGYGTWSINNNDFYNQQVKQQAAATGMTQHVSNLEQVDNLTTAIRRAMTERYKIEF